MTRKLLTVAGCLTCLIGGAQAMTLGIDGTSFALDGKRTFLLGLSYYAGLGAPKEFVQQDLDEMKAAGWNWIRVWATWDLNGRNVSAVDETGAPRQPYFGKLTWLVRQADRRGMAVDVTLTRGNLLPTQEAHLKAVQTLAAALKPFRNVYLDLANERDVRDARYVSLEELGELSGAVRAIDPDRLITASGNPDRNNLPAYLDVARLDFISPHLGRRPGAPAETLEITRRYLEWMREIGHLVPVHYQEPFRRDYSPWQPVAQDFLADLRGAVEGGAAGWCLHNGSPREDYKGPTRSFDMSREKGRLFDQLDAEEMAVFRQGPGVVSEAQKGRQ